MKYVIICILFLNTNLAFSQLDKVNLYFGGSVGSESVLGIPKAGISYSFHETEKFDFRFGLEGSAWIVFTFFYSCNIYQSIEYKIHIDKNETSIPIHLMFENSIGYFNYPEIDFGTGNSTGPFTHYTYTPKIGISYLIFQVKIGNSFFLRKRYDQKAKDYRLLKILQTKHLNPTIELGVVLRFNEF